MFKEDGPYSLEADINQKTLTLEKERSETLNNFWSDFTASRTGYPTGTLTPKLAQSAHAMGIYNAVRGEGSLLFTFQQALYVVRGLKVKGKYWWGDRLAELFPGADHFSQESLRKLGFEVIPERIVERPELLCRK